MTDSGNETGVEKEMPDIENNPHLDAMLEFLPRMGLSTFSFRYSDDDDPLVWMAIAGWDAERAKQLWGAEGPQWEADSSTANPTHALMRLLERLVDGGKCQHCDKPTGFTLSADVQLLDELVCWYQYDPELKNIRRGCEGEQSQ